MTKQKKYATSEGVYLGAMLPDLAPKDAVEVATEPPLGASDARWIDGEWKRPEPVYCVDEYGNSLGWYSGWNLPEGWIVVSPPEHGLDKYDHGNKKWIDFEKKYSHKRELEYSKITVGEQLDAVYKYLTANNLVRPDATKPADTPEGWVARIQKIKQDNPKPR